MIDCPQFGRSAVSGRSRVVETVVLASNEEGLRFAERHGFVEIDRYTLDGDTTPFVDLRLTDTAA